MVLIVKFFASLKTSQDEGYVYKWSRCFDPSDNALARILMPFLSDFV